MNLLDWRDVPADALAPLYTCERDRWLRTLQWDSAASWREVEQARTSWGLPGFVATDAAGRIRGFSFFLAEDGRIDIGGIVSDHECATDALLDGVVATASTLDTASVRIMTYETAVALRSSLRARGFDVQSHLYLSRTVTIDGSLADATRRSVRSTDASGRQLASAPVSFDTWRDGDASGIARLLYRAYDRAAGALFAPNHQMAEWETYVSNLVANGVCGTLNPDATRILRDDGEIRAVALITDISPRTAHLVQMAVDPALRERGIGRALLDSVDTWLVDYGYRAITLMTAAANHRARALYDAAGFRHDANFIAGERV